MFIRAINKEVFWIILGKRFPAARLSQTLGRVALQNLTTPLLFHMAHFWMAWAWAKAPSRTFPPLQRLQRLGGLQPVGFGVLYGALRCAQFPPELGEAFGRAFIEGGIRHLGLDIGF